MREGCAVASPSANPLAITTSLLPALESLCRTSVIPILYLIRMTRLASYFESLSASLTVTSVPGFVLLAVRTALLVTSFAH
jgi:hypothetical protein